jgi:anti-anti-sigma factor
MLISTEAFRTATIVRLHSDVINSSNYVEVRKGLMSLLLPGSRILVDMESLVALDATGLGALLRWIRAAEHAGAQICFFNLSKQVRGFFELLSLHQTIPVRESREEAVAAFAGEMDSRHGSRKPNGAARQGVSAS